jgi:hypothetical protein
MVHLARNFTKLTVSDNIKQPQSVEEYFFSREEMIECSINEIVATRKREQSPENRLDH